MKRRHGAPRTARGGEGAGKGRQFDSQNSLHRLPRKRQQLSNNVADLAGPAAPIQWAGKEVSAPSTAISRLPGGQGWSV